MHYDVRIDECGDVWVVVPSGRGGYVEFNKTRIEQERARQAPPVVIFDEPFTYEGMRKKRGKKQER